MTTENPILKARLAMVQRGAQDLIAWARSLGTTVTIDTVPGKPLAMWHHEMRADVREARRPLGEVVTVVPVSDCTSRNTPALPSGECDCTVAEYQKRVNGIPPGMVYAFHRALSDSDLGAEGFEEIRAGLASAFAHLLTPQTNPGTPTWTLGAIEDGWRDLDHKAHGGFAKVVWRMEDDERSPVNEARALAMVAALNAAAEPKDITRDLSMMLQRLVVAIRNHAPEDSQLKHLGDLTWALLHDRGLSGSITRNTNT